MATMLLALGTAAPALAPALMAGGTILGAAGAIQSGNAADANAKFQAAQLEAQGKTERASSQRQAVEDRKKTALVQSRARAVGAASGGGIDMELAGDIAEEGEYRALTSLWEGEERAKGRQAQAGAALATGRAKKAAGRFKAFGTILSGGSSLLDKYGTGDQSLFSKYG